MSCTIHFVNNRLIPITEYDRKETESVVTALHEIVSDSYQQRYLKQRQFHETIKQFGGNIDGAYDAFMEARSNHVKRLVGTYVIEKAFQVEGMAMVCPNSELLKQRVGAMPGLLRLLGLSEVVPMQGAKVSAWSELNPIMHHVDRPHEESLKFAYSVMRAEAPAFLNSERDIPIWTTEPKRSKSLIHRAINDSGLIVVGEGYYDDTNRSLVVPPSNLYLYTPVKSRLEANKNA